MFAQLQHQHRQQHKAFYFRAFQCRLDLKPYVNHQNKIKCKKTKRGISKVIIVFHIMKFSISFSSDMFLCVLISGSSASF